MVYFFHHYELPVIIQQAQLQRLIRTRQQEAAQGTTNATSPPPTTDATPNNPSSNTAAGQAEQNNDNNNNRNFINRGYVFNHALVPVPVMRNRAINLVTNLRNIITDYLSGAPPVPLINNNNTNNNNMNNATRRVRMINFRNLQRINLGSIQIIPIANQVNINSTTATSAANSTATATAVTHTNATTPTPTTQPTNNLHGTDNLTYNSTVNTDDENVDFRNNYQRNYEENNFIFPSTVDGDQRAAVRRRTVNVNTVHSSNNSEINQIVKNQIQHAKHNNEKMNHQKDKENEINVDTSHVDDVQKLYKIEKIADLSSSLNVEPLMPSSQTPSLTPSTPATHEQLLPSSVFKSLVKEINLINNPETGNSKLNINEIEVKQCHENNSIAKKCDNKTDDDHHHDVDNDLLRKCVNYGEEGYEDKTDETGEHTTGNLKSSNFNNNKNSKNYLAKSTSLSEIVVKDENLISKNINSGDNFSSKIENTINTAIITKNSDFSNTSNNSSRSSINICDKSGTFDIVSINNKTEIECCNVNLKVNDKKCNNTSEITATAKNIDLEAEKTIKLNELHSELHSPETNDITLIPSTSSTTTSNSSSFSPSSG